jgi:hypothetical protein
MALRSSLSPSPAPIKRARLICRAWSMLFSGFVLLSAIGLVGGVLGHYLTHGIAIFRFAGASMVIILVLGHQINSAALRIRLLEDEQISKIKRAADPHADDDEPIFLTQEQLAWCAKSNVVNACLVALQKSRPEGVLLKSDLRGLIALRRQTLGGVHYNATEIVSV